MRFTQLSVVRHRVTVGSPLPFNVFNNDQTLLLAKGYVVQSAQQLENLFERGTLVDLAEVFRGADAVRHAPANMLGQLWSDNITRMHRTLSQARPEAFREALDDAAKPVEALIDRDPDLAILQVMRQEGNLHMQYGLNHAIHTAIVCRLVAKRLEWSEDEANRAFKAALTMNLSMFELQGVLAQQPGRPTDEQMRQIRSHPVRSRAMLEQAGVTDKDWLVGVEQHHETGDRMGYPMGIGTPSELATLLNRADIYAAKLSPRAGRDPLPADRAGRELFMRDPGNPMTAALVKEFGVYPPGCYVSLASGETGVVVKRGPTVMAPVVAVLVDRHGVPVVVNVKRDTANPAYAVAGAVPPQQMKVRMAPESLAVLAAA
jgi:HD-GYP domain-containing protein (c-di-GMP phosphodiesterase class II)